MGNATAQNDRLQFNVHTTIALFESLNSDLAPDITRPSALRKRMLGWPAIIGNFLDPDGAARDICLLRTQPHNLDLLLGLHYRCDGKCLLSRNNVQPDSITVSCESGALPD